MSIITSSLKIIFLGALDALGVWAFVDLLTQGNWRLLIPLFIGLFILNFALLSKKAYPLRYILPGLFFFGLMVVYPIFYNLTISFTNYGTGHLLSKKQVIEQFRDEYYIPEGSEEFSYQVFKNSKGDLKILLISKDTGKAYLSKGDRLGLVNLHDPRFSYKDQEIVKVDGYQRLNRKQIIQNLSAIQDLAFHSDEGVIKFTSLSKFRVYKPLYHYDEKEEVLTNLKTGKVYQLVQGTFTSSDGERLSPGYRSNIGFSNYIKVFANPLITGPFLRVFSWTFLWAFFSVATTFALGLFLAILLNNPNLKFRYLYRTLLIIPYAIPGFISVLIWRGLMNTDFGVINNLLQTFFSLTIPWFQNPIWAKVALVLVNLWLGFPYMMIISLGALQSIPPELYEVARIDGANRWRQFWHITLPLLLISIAPLLIGSFAFNFNNFTVIYLLTEGGPPISGTQTPAGATDILISYTYKLAFAARGADYGFAAAISVIIFLIIGTISAINFRFTGYLERMSEGL